MDNLISWLEEILNQRGWRPADLARAAQLPDATISNILNQNRKAGPDVCRAIAQALQVDEEDVFRRAGLLSPIPPAVAEEREAIHILRRLPPQFRAVAVNILRALQPGAGALPPPLPIPGQALAEAGATYRAGNSHNQELLDLWTQTPDWMRGTFISSLRHAIDELDDNGDLDQQIATILADYPELHDIIEEAQHNLSEQAIRALLLNIRIFTTQHTERDRFSHLHLELSNLFAKLAS